MRIIESRWTFIGRQWARRSAQSKVVRMMVPDLGTKEIEGNIESA